MDSPPDGLTFHAPSIEELQQLIPAYEIGGFIAQGGMGAVYSARQISLDRPVAIKILPRQFGADPQFRASFEAEAKSMARLNHPNLIGVFDFGDVDGMLYIIMELVDGKSLHHSAHGKLIEQCEAARLVSGICRGLAHAHRAGILHRDIKPGNILLGPGAQPKIGDFGLARPVGQDHNPDEIVWGTPGYSAPEVVEHPQDVDHRADIFAVGVLLYELLTGQLPTDPWTQPSRLAKCDPAFDAIIERATQPTPKLRYDSARDLATELDAVVKKLTRGVVLRTTSPAGRKTPPPPPSAARPVQTTLTPSKSRSAPILIAMLVIAVVASGALIFLNNTKSRDEGSNPPAPPKVRSPDPVAAPDVKVPPRKTRVPKTSEAETGPRRPDPKPSPEPPKPKPEPKPQPPAESTTQTLARIKEQLRTGNLSQLPARAAEYGASRYLLVDQQLSWRAASHFAEDHGAQLAVLESPEALAWAASQFKIITPLWIGLSDSGTEGRWHWLNGKEAIKSLWAPGQPNDSPSPEDGEDFAALLPDGQLDDLPPSRELFCLLEWPDPSAKTGSIAQQLARTGEAIKAKRAPVFPAGARNIDGSRFLLVPHSGSWDEASAIAIAAGGHLAVPSNETEAAWIRNSLQATLVKGDACWLGGLLAGRGTAQWRFVTGERFSFVTWAPGQPDGDADSKPALQVKRDATGQLGYQNSSEESGQSNYFLMEWSAPSRRNLPSEKELRRQAATAEDWLATQRQESAERENLAFQRWQRRHQKNVADFAKDIQSEANTARRQESGALKRIAKEFADQIKESGRVPEEIGDLAARFVGRLHRKAAQKQTQLWTDYEPEFLAAQERYLADLQAEQERRFTTGDREGADYLGRELEAAAETSYFLDILSGDFPEVPDAEAEQDDEDK